MNQRQEIFHASDTYVMGTRVTVHPIGWFSKLLWPFIRYNAYAKPEKVSITISGGGGSGGRTSSHDPLQPPGAEEQP